MNGDEICKVIKKTDSTSHIPVILLTARTLENELLNAYNAGADAFIAKPFHIIRLKAQVQNLLDSRQVLQKKYQGQIQIKPTNKVIDSMDEQFLKKAIKIVEEHMEDSEFSVQDMVRHMGMSKTALYRKLKDITSLSTSDFIRTIRLQRARDLLEQGQYNVSEACFEVGFNSVNYFIKCFKEKYGETPKQFSIQNQASSRH